MKILVNGACGRMGTELCSLLACGYHGHSVAAAVDPAAVNGSSVYRSFGDCPAGADILVDFSQHGAVSALCGYALQQKLPVVIATTGHTDAELALICRTAESIPVFLSANLSLGIALLSHLVRTAAEILPETDIEIIELHHNRKLDSPSGTAQKLAEDLRTLRPDSQIVFTADGYGTRRPEEIRVHSLRMGSHPGTHTVCFGSDEQTLTLTHAAHSPRIYAAGAIRAAEFLLAQKPGLYRMPQLLANLHILQEGG